MNTWISRILRSDENLKFKLQQKRNFFLKFSLNLPFVINLCRLSWSRSPDNLALEFIIIRQSRCGSCYIDAPWELLDERYGYGDRHLYHFPFLLLAVMPTVLFPYGFFCSQREALQNLCF